MAVQEELDKEHPGASLTEMLTAHRMFLESIHSLMRYLETALAQHEWQLIRPGSYSVTTDGYGRGLARFDWAMSHAGVAFVPKNQTSLTQGSTRTEIPSMGLELLVFQVTCLDRSPGEPVVWYAGLRVAPVGDTPSHKWEDYQSTVFGRLQPGSTDAEATSGSIRPETVTLKGTTVSITGSYAEVPVAQLLTEQDVATQLVAPALND